MIDRSVHPCVVSTVSALFNHLPPFFCMRNSSRCIDAPTLSLRLVSPVLLRLLFLADIISQHHIRDVRPYASSSVFCSLVQLFKIFFATLKNCPEYLTRGTAQVSISYIKFLLYRLVLSTFLVLLRYSCFKFFLSFQIVIIIIIIL